MSGDRPWVLDWSAATASAAVAATAFDTLLLHYRRAYFTGGFLATDYITRPSEAGAFLAGSLLTDAAAVGVVTALALGVSGRLGARRNVALVVAIVLGLAPVVAANVVEYKLATYLGDTFDLGLLFDLAGKSPAEILAVSSAHAARFAWLTIGSVIAAATGLWVILRFLPRGGERAPLMRRWSVIAPLGLLFVGALTMTLLRSGSDVLDNGLRRKPTGRFLGEIVEAATDIDRDGYGVLGRPDDPNLLDRGVRPYALDIPGNGIDEDGVGGDLPADIDAYREGPDQPPTWRSSQDVVLIVLESFRADARGAALGARAVTPVLDALAAQGVGSQHAYSHNGYTVQSRRHIFTGSTADIRGDDTLIDDFKRHGYEVAYFSGQDDSFGGPDESVGFERADVFYDARADRDRRYSDFTTAGSLAVPFDVVEERVGQFLDRRRADRPLFLYVNYHDTHFPYHHRGIQPLVSSAVVEQADISPDHAVAIREMYMNTASNVDRSIGNVLAHVRKALGRDPGVIVVSDHGESLFDEGFLGHGYALNDAQTRIPLVVANLPMVITEPFAQADLRDEIGRALERPYVPGAQPTLAPDPAHAVFQYLGLITHPAQIALNGTSSRIAYDFRERRVQVGRGPWQRPEDVSPDEHARFVRLVQTWERMMLARHAGE